MRNHTVVGWNRTEAADTATSWAAQRADKVGEELLLVRVVPPKMGEENASLNGDADSVPDCASEAEEIEFMQMELREKYPHLQVNTEVTEGEPVPVLTEYSTPSALVVVGTGARESVPYRYGWSVGALLAASARGPMAIIPSDWRSGRDQVVVGVDGSVGSLRALEFAAGEAERIGLGLRLVYAWLAPPVSPKAYQLNPEFLGWLRESHESVLRHAVDLVRAGHPDMKVDACLENDSAPAALLAHGEEAALLVVGSRRSGPIRRALLGSVSDALILRMHCPLIVVGEPDDAAKP